MPSIENEHDYLAKGQRALVNALFRRWDALGARARRMATFTRGLPLAVKGGVLGYFTIVSALWLVSFSVGNVLVQPGTVEIALAKPAQTGRLIRQNEVAHFGNKVSSAFGVRNEVAYEFADWILEASERQDIAPELLASLVVTESSFRKSARSSVGAVGPAQVRPEFWGKFCGAADLTDPEQNIYCGAQVLSHLLERCEGDQVCALAAYNVGPYANRQAAAQRYVNKIDHYLSTLESQQL
ncbi:MAG: lytic transglycosylase domain-containing protein [Pseudomonadota bacterium]